MEKNGRLILEQIVATYAQCHSYSDTGTVHTITPGEEEQAPNGARFKTAFVRPGRFRFEHYKPPHRHIIWCEGNDVRSNVPLGSIERKDYPLIAIADATGISEDKASWIPSILRRKVNLNAHRVELVGEQVVRDARCYHLRVQRYPRWSPIDLWIDRLTLLIHKLHERTDGKELIRWGEWMKADWAKGLKLSGVAELAYTTQIDYEPCINRTIPEESLAFDPLS